MDLGDSSYLLSTYDSEIIQLLSHALQLNYDLHLNSSTLGLSGGNDDTKAVGSGSNDTAEHETFPILIHRPTIYHKINIMKRSKVIFLAPFANDVWLVLALVLLVVTIALTYVLAREVQLRESETGSRSQVQWQLSEILLVSLGALCQQGTTLNPQAPSSRTLFLAVFVMAVLVYTAYNASIISFAESFVTSGRAVSTPSLYVSDLPHFELDERDENKLKRLSVDKSLKIKRTAPTEVLAEILNGSAILLADQTLTRDIFHRHCRSTKRLCKVKESSFPTKTYRRVLKLDHNKYKRVINHSLLRLKEFGLLDRTKRRLFKTWPLCEAHRACCSQAVSIYLNDLYPAFYLLGAGVGLSLTLLSIELLVFQCSKFLKRGRKGVKKIRPSRDRWCRMKKALFCMASVTESPRESI